MDIESRFPPRPDQDPVGALTHGLETLRLAQARTTERLQAVSVQFELLLTYSAASLEFCHACQEAFELTELPDLIRRRDELAERHAALTAMGRAGIGSDLGAATGGPGMPGPVARVA